MKAGGRELVLYHAGLGPLVQAVLETYVSELYQECTVLCGGDTQDTGLPPFSTVTTSLRNSRQVPRPWPALARHRALR